MASAPDSGVQLPTIDEEFAAQGTRRANLQAIDEAPAGSVIVVDGGGYSGRAVWGSIMSTAAMGRGLVGAVIDGYARDRGDTEAMAFPVFALGVTPRGPRGRSDGTIGAPIVCAGVQVAPGDRIVADEDGVVVLPADESDAILELAHARMRAEAVTLQALQDGESIGQLAQEKRERRERAEAEARAS